MHHVIFTIGRGFWMRRTTPDKRRAFVSAAKRGILGLYPYEL